MTTTKFKRELKNVVYNYTDAETKVREATSNDPWGPSSALMSELADYTYHVQAYSFVMGMLWKRLNDHGRNWRHVYKSLVVLEYLIKTGSERVAQQCKDNLFSIQTLKDFQYVDKDGKDQGTNVREKAKQLVALLKDDKKLKEERARAIQARERHHGVGSEAATVELGRSPNSKRVQFGEATDIPTSPTADSGAGKKIEQNVEQARPSDQSEEELQLKLALQLSKQQADEEDKLRKQEEESLKAAIAISEAEANVKEQEQEQEEEEQAEGGDLLVDLSSSGVLDPWLTVPAEPPPSYDTVAGGALNDPWATIQTSQPVPPSQDPFAPWGGVGGNVTFPTQPPAADPWTVFPTSSTSAPLATNPATSLPPLSTTQPFQPVPTASLNPFDLSTLGTLPPIVGVSPGSSPKPSRVEDKFLGQNATLVDLDTLAAVPPPKIGGPTPQNPFGPPIQQNPFDANKPPAPTLNQLVVASHGYNSADLLPPPLIPLSSGAAAVPPLQSVQPTGTQSFNPFS